MYSYCLSSGNSEAIWADETAHRKRQKGCTKWERERRLSASYEVPIGVQGQYTLCIFLICKSLVFCYDSSEPCSVHLDDLFGSRSVVFAFGRLPPSSDCGSSVYASQTSYAQIMGRMSGSWTLGLNPFFTSHELEALNLYYYLREVWLKTVYIQVLLPRL